VKGFKTCADVAKAEAEGEIVLYTTDPEHGTVKMLAAFNELFPKIETNYIRLQAGALYQKLLSERQAKQGERGAGGDVGARVAAPGSRDLRRHARARCSETGTIGGRKGGCGLPLRRPHPRLQAASCSMVFCPERDGELPILIVRGFIASGTSRTRSIWSSPLSKLAPVTLT
jgi:hypothetical protein